MHEKYTTDSIILRRVASGDSAYFWVLTKAFGLVQARAQGVRKSTSKLAGSLQEFSLGNVSLVRTRAGWKVATSAAEKNFYFSADHEARRIMARFAEVLIRLIKGEAKDERIFELVWSAFEDIGCAGDRFLLEVSFLSRLLHILGYLDEASLRLGHRELVRAINRGLKESQL